ncbi:MAG: TlpA family protein disulfide reductase [Bryobacteraceae bacterium]|nr:TlpA family protein disulfide reductase [Bryobacteraceae bacterium]
MSHSLVVIAALLLASIARAQTGAAQIWTELKAKRAALASLHQEFDTSRSFKTGANVQSSVRQITLDIAGNRWRERTVSGSGDTLRLSDGAGIFSWAAEGEEYVREKAKDTEFPPPYNLDEADWSKARELSRRPCGVAGLDHPCLLLEVPLKAKVISASTSGQTQRASGMTNILIDLDTGLILSSRSLELVQVPRGEYLQESTYTLKRLRYGGPPEAATFQLPAGLKEVKQLSARNVSNLKKEFIGQPAPDFSFLDLAGKPVRLTDFKGKILLLDFWTTWCPPCRADAPALDKLYRKYQANDLAIVGISVSEERAVVEKFLQQHPHPFPIVLTTENEMPRAYQAAVFPTYLVIDRDGKMSAVAQGYQGFGDLRRLLKKAGLDLE